MCSSDLILESATPSTGGNSSSGFSDSSIAPETANASVRMPELGEKFTHNGKKYKLADDQAAMSERLRAINENGHTVSLKKAAIKEYQLKQQRLEASKHAEDVGRDFYYKGQHYNVTNDFGDKYKVVSEDGDVAYLKKSNIQNAMEQNKRVSGIKEDLSAVKDRSGLRYFTTDAYRNFRDFFGKHFEKYKKAYLDPLDASKGDYIRERNSYLKGLQENVINRGIKKKSTESELMMRYGEGKNLPEGDPLRYTLDDLKKDMPYKWEDIVKADEWMRKTFDELRDKINAVRAKIYPNNPEKQIGFIKDYYHHFKDFSGGYEDIFDMMTTPADISPSLAGISENTKPKSKWLGLAQKRFTDKTDYDAVGSFLDYLPAAEYAVHIDPHIANMRGFLEDLQKAAELSGQKPNNFINWLKHWTDGLSEKTNPADRFAQDFVIPGGRKAVRAIRWLQNRAAKNVLLCNLGSMLVQPSNMIQGAAATKQYFPVGAGRLLKSIFVKDDAMAASDFLTERYGDRMMRKFDVGMLKKAENAAGYLLDWCDELGTRTTWQANYAKALAKKIANPIKYADDETRMLVAGRGIGEMPLSQRSFLYKLVAPFTVEVNNTVKVLEDMVGKRDVVGLATFFVGSWLYNQMLDKTRGSSPLFDPIQAFYDAFTGDMTTAQKVGRVAGEFVSALPAGQLAAQIYPEKGFNLGTIPFVGKVNTPTRKDLLGDGDPTRYGTGIFLAKATSEPWTYLGLPFGGLQVKKTLGAIKSLRAPVPGVYSSTDGKGINYPIAPTLSNYAKGLAFGSGSFNETSDYRKAQDDYYRMMASAKAMGAKKSQARMDGLKLPLDETLRTENANSVMYQINKLQSDIKKTLANKDMTPAERTKAVNELYTQRRLVIENNKSLDTANTGDIYQSLKKKELISTLAKKYANEWVYGQQKSFLSSDINARATQKATNDLNNLGTMKPEEKRKLFISNGIEYFTPAEQAFYDEYPEKATVYSDMSNSAATLMKQTMVTSKLSQQEKDKLTSEINLKADELARKVAGANVNTDEKTLQKAVAATGAEYFPPEEKKYWSGHKNDYIKMRAYREIIRKTLTARIKRGTSADQRVNEKMKINVIAFDLGRKMVFADDATRRAALKEIGVK